MGGYAMLMSFRWYGSKLDPIPLQYIRQIPGIRGIVTSLPDIRAGEKWPLERILEAKKEVEEYGLLFHTIESVNVHEDIKLGAPPRDRYIENYIRTLENLGKAGIKVVCYNFMPVFDWTRSNLAKLLPDGSTALSYDKDILNRMEPDRLIEEIKKGSRGLELPGWEPERLREIQKLLDLYGDMDEEKLFANLEYFLEAVIPVAEKNAIRMAIHPDDPPWSVFGLPRIASCPENLERIIRLVDSPANGLTLCSGSLGADPDHNIPEIIRRFGKMGRVHFGHVRNIKILQDRTFDEAAHKDDGASLDMYEIMMAFYDIGFTGPIRPDHGRMIWGEQGRPGYGLYDRALGAVYLTGLWDAIERSR
jgi:mannonate dehydratase